jgi:hypothetical protein
MGKQKQSRDNKQPKDKIITNPENIIKGINESCQHYFNESTFVLSHILSPHGYRYIISGNPQVLNPAIKLYNLCVLPR